MKTNFTVSCVVVGLVLAAGNLRAADDTYNSDQKSRSSATDYKSSRSADMGAHDQVLASKIMGKTVKNDQNQTIGEVKDLVMDSSQTVRYAIVSTGGAAGIGAKKIAVPINSLQCSHDGNVTLSATKDELKNASTTPMGTWTTVQGQAWIKNVDGFYGQPLAMNTRFERDAAGNLIDADNESVRAKAAPQTLNILSGEQVGNDYTPSLKSDANNNSRTPADSSDMTVRNQVHKKLEQSYTTDQLSTVRITVNNGTVTLTGSVADQADRQKIESQAKAVAGVNAVDNQLTVRSE